MSNAYSGLLVALLLLSFCATRAAADPARIAQKVALRSGPGPAFGVIAVMPPGAKVDVQKCNEEWCRVKFGRRVGYASRDGLSLADDSYASAVPPPGPPAPKAVDIPSITRWRDRDWRDARWRDLEWRHRINGR